VFAGSVDLVLISRMLVLHLCMFRGDSQLGESVFIQFMEDGVVCPAILQKGLFTTSAVDNIDHNPSATTATISCHGTDINAIFHKLTKNRFPRLSRYFQHSVI
jgi:cytochrome c553